MLKIHKTLTIKQLAELCGVSTSSIRRWADEGNLPDFVIRDFRTQGGHRRFLIKEVTHVTQA